MQRLGNWPATLTPDGTCVRDYVHVSDLARAHLAALDYLRSGGESRTLNCGYGRGYSVREVVDAVRMVAGVDFETRQAPRRAGDPASIVANSDQLVSLGWKPELNDLSKMIEHARNWEKKLASVETTARGRPSSVDNVASNASHVPATQAPPQSTLRASTISESWVPMDSDAPQKSNCKKSAGGITRGRQAG
jgi:hypothetical protein